MSIQTGTCKEAKLLAHVEVCFLYRVHCKRGSVYSKCASYQVLCMRGSAWRMWRLARTSCSIGQSLVEWGWNMCSSPNQLRTSVLTIKVLAKVGNSMSANQLKPHQELLILICALAVVVELEATTRKVHGTPTPRESTIVRRNSSKTWLQNDSEFASAYSAI